ncbi:MAG: hypothetical protein J0I07_18515 [Myxococcales bacterium]|nr:hypothetical protein [Myxococcales bacterium]
MPDDPMAPAKLDRLGPDLAGHRDQLDRFELRLRPGAQQHRGGRDEVHARPERLRAVRTGVLQLGDDAAGVSEGVR